MDSPVLSRPPSATSLFSPGPHRRSHPNLAHLSLAPLTPKYPIDPADYHAYFDPQTSSLHTSASLSNFALPSPGGILSTPLGSRVNSKTRLKRKTKSTVFIRAPGDPPSGALTSQGFGVKKSGLRVQTDSSWLVQTGLALTEGSRESKGQLWIAQRASSTSLQNFQETRSGRSTPNRSRRNSRARLKELTMTAPPELRMVTTEHEYKPDWADSQTQAEIAAELDREMTEELEMGYEDEYFRDRYGMVDFDGQFDSEDEDDVREVVKKGFKLGKWVDGLVDVFLKLDEENDEVPDLEKGEPDEAEIEIPTNSDSPTSDGSIESPPDKPKGLWDDVRWFGRVVARTVGS